MKNFILVTELLKDVKRRKKGIMGWIDRLRFIDILIIWISIVLSFGVLYYFFGGHNAFLYYNLNQGKVDKITDIIYFSFVTATTTGFGDIIPIGTFKLVSIFEVICGLLLLALVTSKLVSIKQDMILNELYELSFDEKINRLRSSLLLFRQNLSRIMSKVEEGNIKKREVAEIYMYLSPFEDELNEILALLGKEGESSFTKNIDNVNMELILISILNSFEKLNELVIALNEKGIEWRREIVMVLIGKCIKLNEAIFEKVNSSKKLATKTVNELNIQKREAILFLQKNLNPETIKEAK